MKALILNSGLGHRMGKYAEEHPKCMTILYQGETILSRQLKMLAEVGVSDIVITTGPFAEQLMQYCFSLDLPIHYTFVHNERYNETNYIYSIYKAKDELYGEDILLMHGDLVFEYQVLEGILANTGSLMTISSKEKISEKDFKAVIVGDKIKKVGVEFEKNLVAAQPLYKLEKSMCGIWLDKIAEYCETGTTSCYAEEALNEITDRILLTPFDIGDKLCHEIDDKDDLIQISARTREVEERIVYMGFATDVIHSGHIAIIKKASHLGKLVIGVLSDQAVASYRRFPLVPYQERKKLLENMQGVYKVVEQKELSYRKNLLELRPYYVVHGDDWHRGIQKSIRDEVIAILNEYGGKLVEFPYMENDVYQNIERQTDADRIVHS